MAKSQKSIETKEAELRLVLSLNLYASFYPKYYFLETTLKNRLYHSVKQTLGQNWFEEQLRSSNDKTIFKVEAETILRRKPKGFVLKDKGLLVESGLGLWVELFNRDNYKMLKGVPILIFTKLPPKIKRKDIYQKLTRVKELRNQLAHYRIPPLTESSELDIILEINDDLRNLLKWLGISSSTFDSKEFRKSLITLRKTLSDPSFPFKRKNKSKLLHEVES